MAYVLCACACLIDPKHNTNLGYKIKIRNQCDDEGKTHTQIWFSLRFVSVNCVSNLCRLGELRHKMFVGSIIVFMRISFCGYIYFY